ncbi:MAG: VanW family protein, partial [Oscillospiraceae bacterium]|nr:VanW family protein [Oscillospiraceae bacterium]
MSWRWTESTRLQRFFLRGRYPLPKAWSFIKGEEFSYNKTLGKRTAERGYKSAGAYAGGLEVEQIGG